MLCSLQVYFFLILCIIENCKIGFQFYNLITEHLPHQYLIQTSKVLYMVIW